MMTATAGRTPCEKRIYILHSNVATSLSPKYKELGHFTLLFCIGRQKKMTKIQNARAQPLLCSLNLLFGVAIVAVAVAVAVVVC